VKRGPLSINALKAPVFKAFIQSGRFFKKIIADFKNAPNFVKKYKKMEEIIEDIQPIAINPDSPMAQGLLRMLQHKQLREKFWLGDITLEELNKQLLEKGIRKQYEHSTAV
jgi:hypothetical protein